MMVIILSILVGFFASFMSSIFGGGAGLISVPGIYWIVVHFYTHTDDAMQMTLATGSGMAIPLGLMATLRQRKYKNIDYPLLKKTIWSMSIGGVLGALVISNIASDYVKLFFGIMILLTAIWMWRYKINLSKAWNPHPITYNLSGGIIGTISTALGVSVFTVPFLSKAGLDIKKAIGTSTTIVFTYSTLAGIAFIIIGIFKTGTSLSHIGYLNTTIFLSAVIPSLIGSIVGVKLVHILPQIVLKRLFVLMMFIVATLMLIPK
ncbi:MAG: sulfite exporter TauE/SafE family protein [Gammaproteobacteria bacterium]|nr:MAG: sulfite exporter TauE/SafE family protein [Gammaproteobacteria bacterium]UTW41818.1 sulfite exporter TauE/SafE family protein [bacterium SCSIO 12844]